MFSLVLKTPLSSVTPGMVLTNFYFIKKYIDRGDLEYLKVHMLNVTVAWTLH